METSHHKSCAVARGKEREVEVVLTHQLLLNSSKGIWTSLIALYFFIHFVCNQAVAFKLPPMWVVISLIPRLFPLRRVRIRVEPENKARYIVIAWDFPLQYCSHYSASEKSSFISHKFGMIIYMHSLAIPTYNTDGI